MTKTRQCKQLGLPPKPEIGTPLQMLNRILNKVTALCAGLALLGVTKTSAAEHWRQALTFHASFDRGVDADFARGDKRLYNAPSMNKRAEAKPGSRNRARP